MTLTFDLWPQINRAHPWLIGSKCMKFHDHWWITYSQSWSGNHSQSPMPHDFDFFTSRAHPWLVGSKWTKFHHFISNSFLLTVWKPLIVDIRQTAKLPNSPSHIRLRAKFCNLARSSALDPLLSMACCYIFYHFSWLCFLGWQIGVAIQIGKIACYDISQPNLRKWMLLYKIKLAEKYPK